MSTIKKEFNISIAASPNIVWHVLWDQNHYRQWTHVFCEGSYYVSDLKEGSGVHFIAPNGEGMFSKVAERVENEKMVFAHIGVLKDFEEQPMDDKTLSWSGAKEAYFLTKEGDNTLLTTVLDMAEEHSIYFDEVFPKALAEIKRLAEQFAITISAQVHSDIEDVWKRWNQPEHITQWYFAVPEWYAPTAVNDLRVGAAFKIRMSAKDHSFGFDFEGVYTELIEHQLIAYALGDGRKVSIHFEPITTDQGNAILITQRFEPEAMNTIELQQGGWQAILNNFKSYAERQ